MGGKPRQPVRFTQPRAAVPICWLCDRRLHAGGRAYVMIAGEDGHPHPAHASCAEQAGARIP